MASTPSESDVDAGCDGRSLDGQRVWVAGHTGLLGSALWRLIKDSTSAELIGWPSSQLDLTDRDQVHDAVAEARPDVVILAAARVGGIAAQVARPVDFLDENLRIQMNVMEAARRSGVRRLLFVASANIYPQDAAPPIEPVQMLAGPPDPGSRSYAIAKITGVLQVRAYRQQFGLPWQSAVLCNLYGPEDRFSGDAAHVLPALLHRFHTAADAKAPSVVVWGSGAARREFLHADDAATGILQVISALHSDDMTNVGPGADVSIAELASLIANIVGFTGSIEWDDERPKGLRRKLLDSGPLHRSGWAPTIGLEEGIRSTYLWYLANREQSHLNAE